MDALERVKQDILAEIPAIPDKAMFEQAEVQIEGGYLVISCPSTFIQRHLNRDYRGLISQVATRSLGDTLPLRFCVNTGTARPTAARQTHATQMVLPSCSETARTNINPNYTFDQFVVGRCNAFAYEAALAVADDSICRYNPLYFSSDIGLGKSHIAHAIGNQTIKTRGGNKILFTTAREFSQEYVYGVMNNNVAAFRNRYTGSGLSMLFIDDVQYLKDKDKTQIEFSMMLDDLMTSGTQVILSGSRSPKSIPNVNQGLKSRLGSGLVIDIKRPDRATRAEIIRRKASRQGQAMPDSVIEYIATNFRGSLWELEGAVNTVIAYGSLFKTDITLEMVQAALEEKISHQESITLDSIKQFVAANYHISVDEMVSTCRKKRILFPRQVAMYLCRRYTDEPLVNIAQSFGRTHSSVLHSLDVINSKYDSNLTIKKEIDFLRDKLDTPA